jgi:peptidoglycan/LPS O-acetylase OafA/YrhL
MKATFDQRQNNIDFVRIFLALLVILSHSYSLALANERTEPFNLLSRGQSTGGRLAVDLFFILSGFLIAASYERSSSALSYLKKRVARIYPAFILLTLLTVAVILPLAHGRVTGTAISDKALNVIGNTVVLRELGTEGAFPHNPSLGEVNGSLWSIAFEFWCYIGVMLLGLMGLLRSKRFLLTAFIGSIVVSILFAHFKWNISGAILGRIFGYPPFWARLLPMYLAGVVFYRYRQDIPFSPKLVIAALIAMVVAFRVPLGYAALFPIAGTYLVMCFSFAPSIRLNGAARYGDFSYGTYLYAFPIQQLILQAFARPVSPLLLFACAAPVTVVVAAMSWHTVEKRFLRAAHKKAAKPLALELSESRTPVQNSV